jgi:hypothetical protein
MYGLVNRAIEQLVRTAKGDAAWTRVCAHAQPGHAGFLAMRAYPDEVTYRLVAAVSDEMQITPSEALEAFGEYWILYTADEGYGALLNAAGGSLRDFLGQLNQMHGRIETVFPHMTLPCFEVEDVSEREMLLHYVSEREGLAPMVTGLVRGLAKRFGQAVDVAHVKARSADDRKDVFRITLVDH